MRKSCKDKVLTRLEQAKGGFVSGGALAADLGVSRNAIWKAVKTLEQEGYAIEGVSGRGYSLEASSSILSAASIERYLTCEGIEVEYHDSIDSTNTRAKELGEKGAAQGSLVVADKQTDGRGRQGRPFASPAGTGIYFSLLLRPAFELGDVTCITSYAAVCVCLAIEKVFDVNTQIKWVNDIFVGDKKVCGILTESSFDVESASIAYVVVGIGINVYRPVRGFPASAGEAASAILDTKADENDARARLVAETVNAFMHGYASIPERLHLDAYRSRSLLDGRTVDVYEGAQVYKAQVIGINDDFSLEVELAGGKRRSLAAGEVHIPSNQM